MAIFFPIILFFGICFIGPADAKATSRHYEPTVILLQVTTVEQAIAVIHALYPVIRVTPDRAASAIIVEANPSIVQSIRNVVNGIDVKNPNASGVEALSLGNVDKAALIKILRGVYPSASFVMVDRVRMVVRAPATDLGQIRTLVSSFDAPSQSASIVPTQIEGVNVMEATPAPLLKILSREFPHIRFALSGTAIILKGQPDDVGKAKALLAQLDVAPADSKTTTIIRVHGVDASTAANVLRPMFPRALIRVEPDIDSVAITATPADIRSVEGVVKTLGKNEAAPSATDAIDVPVSVSSDDGYEVYTIRSSIPGQAAVGSVATADPQTQIIQTLQQLVPGVRVSPLTGAGQIALIGDPFTLRAARRVLSKIDIPAPLVVLDTQILEIDESTAQNLGLTISPAIGAQFSEIIPPPDAGGAARIGRLQAFTRSPLNIGAQLNLLVQRGEARVLADPRISTLSGHTATIRAGDTINILTTTGGGTGTIATTQLQSFQTGVALDITPIVTDVDEVTVSLHPVVNSLTGLNNGVPQIATRDTQTVVHLKNNETLVIGGLIQESQQHTQDKIPFLGDLPLIGRAFRNDQRSSSRNELVIVVTPHLATSEPLQAERRLPDVPKPQPLPTPVRSAFPKPVDVRTAVAKDSKDMKTPAKTPDVEQVHSDVETYSYGRRPPSNVAGPTDRPQIFYIEAVPTVVSNGTPVKLAAITTTNVTSVFASYGTITVNFNQVSPGIWTSVFPFSTSALSGNDARTQIIIKAKTANSTEVVHAFAINVTRP